MPRIYQIEDKVYDRKIFFTVGDPKKCTTAIVKRWNVDGGFASTDGAACLTFKDKDTKIRVMWFPYIKRTPDGIGIVAHECMHVVAQAFRDTGISLKSSTEEAYTYYLESLVRQVFEKYKK